MKAEQKISVIVPCYNQGRFLDESLQSILAQTYTNWECIIVDDGSIDDTKKIANDFVRRDKRFTYLYKTNGGLSSARNAGIERVSGNWVQFLDADDVLEAEKFSKQLSAYNGEENVSKVVIYADYCFGQKENIYESKNRIIDIKLSPGYFEDLITRWETGLIIPCHCFLFSSDFFAEGGIRFDETLPNHEDFDCWLAIFSINPNLVFIDEVLCRYRISDHSMSTNMRQMGEGFIQVLNKHLKINSYSPATLLLLKKKRLDVLQRYKRFDLMDWKDKSASWKVLSDYYSKRIINKIRFRAE